MRTALQSGSAAPASSEKVPHLRVPSLSLLRIPVSWAPEPSVHVQAIEQATRARVISAKVLPKVPALLRRFDESRFSLLAASAYPKAARERLELCNDWHVWLFLFDDEADERAEVGQRPEYLQEYAGACLAVLRGAPLRAGATPLERFTCDIQERMRRLTSEAWRSRFVQDVERYLFQGTLPAARHWAAGTVPQSEAYLEHRVQDSAMFTALDLIEISQAGQELPEALLALPLLQRMRHLCARVVALCNDLFSFEKEVLWHGNPNNFVQVLRVHRRLGLEEAVGAAIDFINEDLAEFSACERRLGASEPVELKLAAYVEGMKAWLRGNVRWSLVSGRYSSPTSPFPELRRP